MSGVRKALCLSFALLSEAGLGEGELMEAMERLSAVRMDERGTLIYDTQLGKRGLHGGLGLSKPDVILHTAGLENNITTHSLVQWSH